MVKYAMLNVLSATNMCSFIQSQPHSKAAFWNMLVSFSRLPCHAHKRITLKASYKIYSLDFVKTFKFFFVCMCNCQTLNHQTCTGERHHTHSRIMFGFDFTTNTVNNFSSSSPMLIAGKVRNGRRCLMWNTWHVTLARMHSCKYSHWAVFLKVHSSKTL